MPNSSQLFYASLSTGHLENKPAGTIATLISAFFIGLIVTLFFTTPAIAELKVRDVSAAEAAIILSENPEIGILDVRTGFEFNRGHLEGAVNVNYYSRKFRKMLDELDKEKTWLVHCRSGVRSSKTLPIMKEAGFTSVIHLTDGILDWLDADLPVVK